MKKVNFNDDNCIPSPSGCIDWDGGSISLLNVKDGDSLNNVIWEMVNKLSSLSIDSLADIDIQGFLDICQQPQPSTISITSLLVLIRNNETCLKDSITDLRDQLGEIESQAIVDANLKCFATQDNLGNSLKPTRDAFDQLLIDKLCNHETRISSLEGGLVDLQAQILGFPSSVTVDELKFSTCIDPGTKPTSSQVISIADELCDLEISLGNSGSISTALGNTAGDLNTDYAAFSGWLTAPTNLAENYGNLLIEVEDLRQRIKTIETTCCNSTCDDVELGFWVVFNEDKTGLIITFASGAGTNIPASFTDAGSTGTITDKNGNGQDFIVTIVNNAQVEVPIVGLDLSGSLNVKIRPVMTNGSLVCRECLSKDVVTSGICDFCQYCVTGTTGTVTILYEDSGTFVGTSFNPSTTTTTTVGV